MNTHIKERVESKSRLQSTEIEEADLLEGHYNDVCKR